jgi:hypothetical protein
MPRTRGRLRDETGDFELASKAADSVSVRLRNGNVLAVVVKRLKVPDRIVSSLFALAGEERIKKVRATNYAIINR